MTICKICFHDKLIFFATIKSYKYYFCNKCQTLQLVNYSNINTFDPNFVYTTDCLSIRRIYSNSKTILNYIKKVSEKHSSLLDIGSGYGYLLKEAQTKFKYTLGIEPSKNLYKYSKNILKVNVNNYSFERFYKLNKFKKFDVITLIHVIEHVKNPVDFINKALKLLNKGGILFIETPNLNSWLFKFEQKSYTFLTPPEHIFLFSLKSFMKISRKINGIKIVNISTYSYIDHSVAIIKELFKGKSRNYDPFTLKNNTFLHNDRLQKLQIYNFKKIIFYAIFHWILGPIILPFLKLGYNGTFLRLYIKKKR